MASEDGCVLCAAGLTWESLQFPCQVLRELPRYLQRRGERKGLLSCCSCIKALKQSGQSEFSSILEEKADGKSEPSDTRDNLYPKPGGHSSCFLGPRHWTRPWANQRPQSLVRSHSIFSGNSDFLGQSFLCLCWGRGGRKADRAALGSGREPLGAGGGGYLPRGICIHQEIKNKKSPE